MILMSALSLGVAAATVSVIASFLDLPGWTPVTVIANPGVWLSVELLTPDVMALGLSLLAVATFLRNRVVLTGFLLAAAALTKEPYAAVAIGLAGFAWVHEKDPHVSLRLLMIAFVPSILWWSTVQLRLGGDLFQGGNVDLPLRGLVQASSSWMTTGPKDQVLFGLSLIAVLLGLLVVISVHDHLWKWLIAPWLLIAVLSSHYVWDYGNNAARAFAPVITMAGLAWIHRLRTKERRMLAADNAC